MRCRASFWLGALVCVLAASGSARAEKTFVVSPRCTKEEIRASRDAVLSCELKLLGPRDRLLGFTERGDAVIVLADPHSVSRFAPGRLDPHVPDPLKRRLDDLIVFYLGSQPPPLNTIAEVSLIDRYPTGRFVVVRASHGIVGSLAQELERLPGVRRVEPNYPVDLVRSVPRPKPLNVACPPPGGGVGTQGLGVLWGLDSIHAGSFAALGSLVFPVVGVFDNGVLSHPDLVPGGHHDFVGNSSGSDSSNPHGTHVAGIAAAIASDGEGVVGVAPAARVMSLRVLNGKDLGEVSEVAKAFDFAREHGIRVMNQSWAAPYDSFAIREALCRIGGDALVVAAAGDDALDLEEHPWYPAAYKYPWVVSVLAIGRDDLAEESTEHLIPESNFGRVSVDLGAPGANICSTWFSNGYDYLTGNSQAAPYVAGAAARIWAMPQYATKTAVEVKELLLCNVRCLPDLADTSVTGGTLDLGFLATGADFSPTTGRRQLSGTFKAQEEGVLQGVLQTEQGDFALETDEGSSLAAELAALDGQTVSVDGCLRTCPGPGPQRILRVEALEPGD